MLKLFKRGGTSGEEDIPTRTRPSRGWADVLAYLREEPARSLRVLDFGTTSPGNINLLTSLGHSVYMANIVGEAQKADWLKPGTGRGGHHKEFDAERFAAQNLDFSGRDFDIVLLWDTADYLPAGLVPLFFERLRAVVRPGGRLLAFFHDKADGQNIGYARYHLTDGPELRIVGADAVPVHNLLQNRQVERSLEGFRNIRFFQGTDNFREVVATHYSREVGRESVRE